MFFLILCSHFAAELCLRDLLYYQPFVYVASRLVEQLPWLFKQGQRSCQRLEQLFHIGQLLHRRIGARGDKTFQTGRLLEELLSPIFHKKVKLVVVDEEFVVEFLLGLQNGCLGVNLESKVNLLTDLLVVVNALKR
jgi:hypothetical protein